MASVVKSRILVIGAGFAGSVISRELADTGLNDITLIYKRDHIAGNAYDPVDKKTGARYQKYGPHIFHTNSAEIAEYLSRFSQWEPYLHRVEAVLPTGRSAPMPINRDTLNTHFGLALANETEVKAFLDEVRTPIENPENARDYLYSVYGAELTEMFFASYTRRMWNLELLEMNATKDKFFSIMDGKIFLFTFFQLNNQSFHMPPLNFWSKAHIGVNIFLTCCRAGTCDLFSLIFSGNRIKLGSHT